MTARPRVTLMRLALTSGVVTYMAIRSEFALDMAALGPAMHAQIAPGHGLDPGCDIDTLPWTLMPGVERLAGARLAGAWPPVALLGTVEDGAWMSWYPPCPRPPVPPAPAVRGQHG